MKTEDFIAHRASYDTDGQSDFIIPSDIERVLSIAYSEVAIGHFSKTLPDKNNLGWYKEHGYIFIPGPPEIFSMEKIISLKPELFNFLKDQDRTACSENSLETRWIIIGKGNVLSGIYNHLTSDLYREEKGLKFYYPSPAELAWTMLIYLQIKKESLFEGCRIFSSAGNGFDSPLSRRFPIIFSWKDNRIQISTLGAMSSPINGTTTIGTEALVSLPEEDLSF